MRPTHRIPSASVIIGEEPGRTLPALEEYRDWPRGPKAFNLIFGYKVEGRQYPVKIGIHQMTLAILSTLGAAMQKGLRERYLHDGSPPRDKFVDRMLVEITGKVVADLQGHYPDVGAKTVSGRAACMLCAWIALTNPDAQRVINFSALITLQIIFCWRENRYVPFLAADHGDDPPRMRN